MTKAISAVIATIMLPLTNSLQLLIMTQLTLVSLMIIIVVIIITTIVLVIIITQQEDVIVLVTI